jgi:hypothetical protein
MCVDVRSDRVGHNILSRDCCQVDLYRYSVVILDSNISLTFQPCVWSIMVAMCRSLSSLGKKAVIASIMWMLGWRATMVWIEDYEVELGSGTNVEVYLERTFLPWDKVRGDYMGGRSHWWVNILCSMHHMLEMQSTMVVANASIICRHLAPF